MMLRPPYKPCFFLLVASIKNVGKPLTGLLASARQYKKQQILLPAVAWVFADLPRGMDPAVFVRAHIAHLKRQSRSSRNSLFHRFSPAMYRHNHWRRKMTDPNIGRSLRLLVFTDPPVWLIAQTANISPCPWPSAVGCTYKILRSFSSIQHMTSVC